MLSKDCKLSLWALDGAANALVDTHYTPDLILGDLDSISPEALTYFRTKNVPILHLPDQNKTDLEKALEYAATLPFSAIDVYNAWSDERIDHSLINCTFLRQFYKTHRPLSLLTRTTRIFFAKDTTLALAAPINTPFALFGFPQATVTSRGLTYEMENIKLSFFTQNSVCNAFRLETITLDIDGEALVCMGL